MNNKIISGFVNRICFKIMYAMNQNRRISPMKPSPLAVSY